MKAVRIHRFGPPEVIVLDDVPTPSSGKGEVLVRVAATGDRRSQPVRGSSAIVWKADKYWEMPIGHCNMRRPLPRP